VICVGAVGHKIGSAVFLLYNTTVSDFSMSSKFEHGTGQNINIYAICCTVFK